MDYSPRWLAENKIVVMPPWHNQPVEHEIDLSDLSETHRLSPVSEKRWTLATLRAKKKSLERQIQKELIKQAEIAQLREECVLLAMKLEGMRSNTKTIGITKSPDTRTVK
jgi:hypothetical protein